MIEGRSADAVLGDLVGLFPRGRAWARSRSSDFVRLFTGLGAAIARIEAAVATLRDEINPATATLLLGDFERCLGPDPCGLDGVGGEIGRRRLTAWRRWTWKGGQSIPFFVALAALYGVGVTITTVRPSQVGLVQAGDELIDSPEQFVWTVGLPFVGETDAIVGDLVCGDYLGDILLSPIECLFRRYAPAHTVVVFNYTG